MSGETNIPCTVCLALTCLRYNEAKSDALERNNELTYYEGVLEREGKE